MEVYPFYTITIRKPHYHYKYNRMNNLRRNSKIDYYEYLKLYNGKEEPELGVELNLKEYDKNN